MKYILVSAIASGSIFQKADLLYYQSTIITTGIAGDTHSFIRTNRSDILVGKTITVENLQATLDAAGAQFVLDNYPNT